MISTTTPTTGIRPVVALFGAGGLLMGLGGQLHPRGTGAGVDDHLASMLTGPTWTVSHLTLLAGLVAAVAGFVLARRTGVFGPHATAWLPVPIVGWSVAAVELVPHVLAAGEHHQLTTGQATPILDLHLMLQVIATPALGITAAGLAVAVARAAGTPAAWLLAVVGALGGLAYAAAGPLVALTGSAVFAPLFAALAGVAIWLLGTAVRLAVAAGRTPGA